MEECESCSGGRVPKLDPELNKTFCNCDGDKDLVENATTNVCQCASGYYNNATGVDNFDCKICSSSLPNCKTCSSSKTCLTCNSAIFAVSNTTGKCVCVDTKKYVSGTQCLDCPEGCLTCESA